MLYDLIKPLKKLEILVIASSMCLYISMLLIFSSVFDLTTERLLNLTSNMQYYRTQSAYIMWVLLGSVIVIKSHFVTPASELYLSVSLKSNYIYAKVLSYLLYVGLLSVCIYGIYQLIYAVSFDVYIGLDQTFLLLTLNGFVLASFMLLWIRIQSKYTMLLGFLIVILLPTVDISSIDFVKSLLPYLAVLKRQKVYTSVSLSIVYVIMGIELQKLKKN